MKIPIKKYVMDESLSWEDRYHQLDEHHVSETTYMVRHIEGLEELIRLSNVAFALDTVDISSIAMPENRVIEGAGVEYLAGSCDHQDTYGSLFLDGRCMVCGASA